MSPNHETHQEVEPFRLSKLNYICFGGLAASGVGITIDSEPLTVGGLVTFVIGALASAAHERHLNQNDTNI